MKYLTARDGQGSTPHSRERSAQLNGVVRGLYVLVPYACSGRRCELLEQNPNKVIVCAQGCYGIFPMVEFSLLLGGNCKDLPPRYWDPSGDRGQTQACIP